MDQDFPKNDSRKGRDFGPFEILKKIGSGSAGAVWRARHKNLDKIVAVKILSPRLCEDPKFIRRFVAEAQSAGRLSHAHIVRGLDVGEVNDRYYFSMEYVEGPTLEQRLEEGPLDEDDALHVAKHIGLGLEHAWSRGIVHRDVKPSNIILRNDEQAMLLDLGLALRQDADLGERKGAVLGTPDYMSPEQIQGSSSLDSRTDVYSLGITLFRMIAGRLPFDGASRAEVMDLHQNAPLPSMLEWDVEVSRETLRLIENMTAKRPQDRPETLVAEIDKVLANPRHAATSPLRAPSGRLRRSRGPSLNPVAVLAVVAVLFLVGIVALSFLGQDTSLPEQGPPRKGPSHSPPPQLPARPDVNEEISAILGSLDPACPQETVARLKALAAKLDTTEAAMVWEAIRKIRTQEEEHFAPLKDKLLRHVIERLQEDDLPGAQKALQTFRAAHNARYGGLEDFKDLNKLSERINRHAQDRAGVLTKRIKTALMNGRFDKAQSLAEELALMADFVDGADSWRRKVQHARAEWQDRLLAKAERDRLSTARTKALAHVRAWNFSLALSVLEEARAKIRNPDTWKEVSHDIQDLGDLTGFLKDAGGPKNQGVGKPFRAGNTEGTISRVENGRVYLRAGPVQHAVKLRELTPMEMARLVKLGLALDNPSRCRGYALYHIFFHDKTAANSILMNLELDDSDRLHLQKTLNRVTR